MFSFSFRPNNFMAFPTAFQIETLFPAIIAVAFYAFVFLFAEVSRKLVDYTVKKKSSLLHTFLIELIGTAQMCTCVYENSLIVKNYGPSGFFLVVIALQTTAILLNRGAMVSPLPAIEQLMAGKMRTEKFLLILLAQTIGGYSAFRLANSLWYYSLTYSADHHQLFERLPCALVYKVPFHYVFLNELLGSFLLRLALHRLPSAYRLYLVPVLISSFLTFALAYVGIPGLNPVVASSRLQGCPGLDLQWFMITYWCCPVLGWLMAARLDKSAKKFRSSSAKSTGSGKQQAKEKTS